jgi:hypothetical protein
MFDIFIFYSFNSELSLLLVHTKGSEVTMVESSKTLIVWQWRRALKAAKWLEIKNCLHCGRDFCFGGSYSWQRLQSCSCQCTPCFYQWLCTVSWYTVCIIFGCVPWFSCTFLIFFGGTRHQKMEPAPSEIAAHVILSSVSSGLHSTLTWC